MYPNMRFISEKATRRTRYTCVLLTRGKHSNDRRCRTAPARISRIRSWKRLGAGGALMTRKQVTIHYRRFYRNKQTPFTDQLSETVALALQHENESGKFVGKVARRIYREQDDGRVLLLNGVLPTPKQVVFGELLSYDPDANIPLLMHGAEDAAELEVRQGTKPNDAEFLRGVMFFMLRGDHLFMIDQDLGTPALERYIRWILATATATTKDDRIQFIPSLLLGESTELKRVKSIRLEPRPHGSDLFAPDQSEALNTLEETSKTNILDILKAAKFESTVLSRLLEDQNLAVKLKLTLEFRQGRTQMSLDGQDALALLRHVDEEDLVVIGETAMKRRGKLERPKVTAHIEQKGNMLDRADAWKALEGAYDTYKKNGYPF